MVGDLAHGWWWPALVWGPVGWSAGLGWWQCARLVSSMVAWDDVPAWHGMGAMCPSWSCMGLGYGNNVPAWLTRAWRDPGWAGLGKDVPAPTFLAGG